MPETTFYTTFSTSHFLLSRAKNGSESDLWSALSYRFGFNGQEMDNEITGLTGTHTTAEFWEYDSRLGRRWNVDPVVKDWESPYLCFGGNPVCFADPDGLDKIPKNKSGNRPKHHIKKVRRQGAPTTNTNSAGQRYGKGIWYWLTDAYNDLFNDNAAHKVRAGRYVTSPWTQVPQVGQNGPWTTHVFNRTPDYRLRNVRVNVGTSVGVLNFFIVMGGIFPVNYGFGFPLSNVYQESGAVFPVVTNVFRIGMLCGFAPLWGLGAMPCIGIISAAVVIYGLNKLHVNPVHMNRNTFRVWSGRIDGGPTTNSVSIKYRIWQGGAAAGFVNQLLRRILYGFGGNR